MKLGRAMLTKLSKGAETRLQQFSGYINDRISNAAQKLTPETERRNALSATERSGEALRILNEAGVNVSSESLATKDQRQIHEMTKAIMRNELIKGTPLSTSDVNFIVSQVDSLVQGEDPANIQPDVLASYQTTKSLVDLAVSNANAQIQTQTDAASQREQIRQEQQTAIHNEQQSIRDKQKTNNRLVAFSPDPKNPTKVDFTVKDNENGQTVIGLWEEATTSVQKTLAKRSYTDVQSVSKGEVTIKWIQPVVDPERPGSTSFETIDKSITATNEDDWDEYETRVRSEYSAYPDARDHVLRALREAKSEQAKVWKAQFGWSDEELQQVHNITTSEEAKALQGDFKAGLFASRAEKETGKRKVQGVKEVFRQEPDKSVAQPALKGVLENDQQRKVPKAEETVVTMEKDGTVVTVDTTQTSVADMEALGYSIRR